MVWLRETNLSAEPTDTPMEASMRRTVHSRKPHWSNTLRFQASLPPQPNLVDRIAPAAIAVMLVGFLVAY